MSILINSVFVLSIRMINLYSETLGQREHSCITNFRWPLVAKKDTCNCRLLAKHLTQSMPCRASSPSAAVLFKCGCGAMEAEISDILSGLEADWLSSSRDQGLLQVIQRLDQERFWSVPDLNRVVQERPDHSRSTVRGEILVLLRGIRCTAGIGRLRLEPTWRPLFVKLQSMRFILRWQQTC